MTTSECPMCRAAAADEELERVEVWQDSHWRLTVSLSSEVAGFAYLEPKRHIRYITELDGPEAATFGPALARSTDALKDATGAEVVYVYIFGDGVPHLHVHIVPRRRKDGLKGFFWPRTKYQNETEMELVQQAIRNAIENDLKKSR